jgi:hypothetical protein
MDHVNKKKKNDKSVTGFAMGDAEEATTISVLR